MQSDLKIYVGLVKEGTDVWRPVPARHIKDNVYVLLGTPSGNESWKYATGSTVRCAEHKFAGGELGLIAVELANE
jgi:hypothetical protein